MLQKFAMVKYGVFVAKICKHALRASAVRDIWWSPLARQLLPPCLLGPHNIFFRKKIQDSKSRDTDSYIQLPKINVVPSIRYTSSKAVFLSIYFLILRNIPLLYPCMLFSFATPPPHLYLDLTRTYIPPPGL